MAREVAVLMGAPASHADDPERPADRELYMGRAEKIIEALDTARAEPSPEGEPSAGAVEAVARALGGKASWEAYEQRCAAGENFGPWVGFPSLRWADEHRAEARRLLKIAAAIDRPARSRERVEPGEHRKRWTIWRWVIGKFSPPSAPGPWILNERDGLPEAMLDQAEHVVLMPVSEHEAALAEARGAGVEAVEVAKLAVDRYERAGETLAQISARLNDATLTDSLKVFRVRLDLVKFNPASPPEEGEDG